MIELPGLPAGSPISFMAALGLLRVLSEDCGLPVQLGWKNGHAVIGGDVPENLPALLAQQMKGRHQHLEFNWAETTRKIPITQYRQACDNAEQKQDRRALAFLAGWGTDAVLDKDGFVRGTRLDLTSGQQKLIRDLRGLALELQDDTLARSAFTTALFGGDYGTAAILIKKSCLIASVAVKEQGDERGLFQPVSCGSGSGLLPMKRIKWFQSSNGR